jgi:prepilin-type N-terminal cleavage/methylation domain-containing protein
MSNSYLFYGIKHFIRYYNLELRNYYFKLMSYKSKNILNRNNKSGFTLVELLVVISIIGLLSSFAIVSLNSARMKARDALRKGDMAQLRTALNLYYDDNNAYPKCDDESVWDESNPADPLLGSADDLGKVSGCYNNELATALGTGPRPILNKIPKDPKNPTNTPGSDNFFYRYLSRDNGSEYAIIYYLEDSPTVPQIIKGY